MAELIGRMLPPMTYYGMEKPVLTFEVDADTQTIFHIYDELRAAEKLSIKVGKYKQKRSLDANAYCFALIGKIAEKTNVPKEEVYRKAVKEIGGNYDVVCVQDKALEALCESWKSMGLGWQTDTFPSKIDGCTNVALYYGSSTYDVPTMSRLIDNIVQDCKALGIETKSSEELESLLGEWGR